MSNILDLKSRMFYTPKSQVNFTKKYMEITMKKLSMGAAIAIGIGIGTAIGVAIDNIAVGIGIGAALGVVFGMNASSKNDNSR